MVPQILCDVLMPVLGPARVLCDVGRAVVQPARTLLVVDHGLLLRVTDAQLVLRCWHIHRRRHQVRLLTLQLTWKNKGATCKYISNVVDTPCQMRCIFRQIYKQELCINQTCTHCHLGRAAYVMQFLSDL